MDFRLKLRKLVFIAKKQTNRIRDKCTENLIERKIESAEFGQKKSNSN